MIGPPVRDIELELEALQPVPVSVYSESLSPDSINEEEEEPYFTIETVCPCGSIIRLMVQASRRTLRTFQVLLLGELRIVCPLCAQVIIEHGRR